MRDKFGVKVGIESDAFQLLHDFELATGASLSFGKLSLFLLSFLGRPLAFIRYSSFLKTKKPHWCDPMGLLK
ncbi:hypothetical protein FORC4_p080 (plasmid) [Vibrio parahaemolyticus]|nr:hypothetical protein FORC4_p080 [Vibrio parahaemolyticus]